MLLYDGRVILSHSLEQKNNQLAPSAFDKVRRRAGAETQLPYLVKRTPSFSTLDLAEES